MSISLARDTESFVKPTLQRGTIILHSCTFGKPAIGTRVCYVCSPTSYYWILFGHIQRTVLALFYSIFMWRLYRSACRTYCWPLIQFADPLIFRKLLKLNGHSPLSRHYWRGPQRGTSQESLSAYSWNHLRIKVTWWLQFGHNASTCPVCITLFVSYILYHSALIHVCLFHIMYKYCN